MEAVVCLAGVKVGITSSCTSSDQVGGGSTSSVLEPNWLPPGFRFHPTDDELVSYYLAKKVVDSSFAVNAIAEVDLNKCEPWDLPEKAKLGEKEWYFFSLRDRKYPTGMRTNRATDAGYWKATGKDRDVVSTRSPGRLVGMKKTLVFYRGRAPKGEKTNWIMHEYRLEGDSSPRANKDEWVVCRIFQKSSGGKKSFLISDSHIRRAMGNNCNNYPYSSEDGNGRGGSPPSLMDHSPNPTVTDEENGTDCETCAGTDHNTSCYNCSPTAVDQFHESRPQLPWVQAGRPKSEHILLHHGADDNNYNNNILNNNNSPNNHHHHLGQSNINNNIKSCNFSVYDVYDTKTFNMAFRPGFNPFTPTSDLTSLQQRGGSLQRPKTEPSTFCEGEDEAQSSQRELVPDYGSCWTSTDQAAVTSMYNNHTDPNCPAAPSLNNNLQSLQTGGATESSCVTDLSLPYSGENSSLFRYKYGLLDVAASAVDTTGLEILWAY